MLQRLALTAILMLPLSCYGALAQTAVDTPDLTGTWQGSYDCVQGKTGVTLTFSPDGKGGFLGEFAFFALKENPGVPSGSFGVAALYDRAEGSFHVDPRLWIEQPYGYVTVPLVGEVAEDGQAFAGEVLTEGCGTFLVKRFLS